MAFSQFVDLIKWVGRFVHEGTIGLKEEASAPGTPPINELTVYARETGGLTQLFYKDSAGVEHDLSLVSTALQAGQAPVFLEEVGVDESPMAIPGPAGATGVQGLVGAAGLDGEAGEDGLPGVPGLPGLAGVVGSPGLPGDEGDAGEAGPPGAKGDTGATGATGAAGADGAAGAQGAQGPLGPATFLAAEEGDEGPIGPPGPAGTSAVSHNILSATHGDSVAATVVRGDLIVGNSTPAWARLARGTVDGLFPKVSASDLAYAADVAIRTDASNNRLRYLNILCRVANAADQTISDSTATAMTFDTELFDTHAMHDNVTNNSRITVPIAGKYLIAGTINWVVNGTGTRSARLRKNGTTFIGSLVFMPITSGDETINQIMIIDSLAASDYIELLGTQTSGGNLDVNHSDTGQTTWFSISYLGE